MISFHNADVSAMTLAIIYYGEDPQIPRYVLKDRTSVLVQGA